MNEGRALNVDEKGIPRSKEVELCQENLVLLKSRLS
jgi:hypothetical protein